jgi:hypothetical protein
MSKRDAPSYCTIGVEKGQVLLLFSKDPSGTRPSNISTWRLDPRECLEITEAMATAAFEARDGVKPVGPALKATLVEQHRMKLTQRFSVMLATLRPDKLKSDGNVAQALVEAALKEIF